MATKWKDIEPQLKAKVQREGCPSEGRPRTAAGKGGPTPAKNGARSCIRYLQPLKG
jgi:hypothetical protein